ncbi:hypothetical protein WDU94_007384 [Cyamophila willieti]
MSGEQEPPSPADETLGEDELNTTYKPPPQKTIEEILKSDQEDESLRKYKETLLGVAKEGEVVVGKLNQY